MPDNLDKIRHTSIICKRWVVSDFERGNQFEFRKIIVTHYVGDYVL